MKAVLLVVSVAFMLAAGEVSAVSEEDLPEASQFFGAWGSNVNEDGTCDQGRIDVFGPGFIRQISIEGDKVFDDTRAVIWSVEIKDGHAALFARHDGEIHLFQRLGKRGSTYYRSTRRERCRLVMPEVEDDGPDDIEAPPDPFAGAVEITDSELREKLIGEFSLFSDWWGYSELYVDKWEGSPEVCEAYDQGMHASISLDGMVLYVRGEPHQFDLIEKLKVSKDDVLSISERESSRYALESFLYEGLVDHFYLVFRHRQSGEMVEVYKGLPPSLPDAWTLEDMYEPNEDSLRDSRAIYENWEHMTDAIYFRFESDLLELIGAADFVDVNGDSVYRTSTGHSALARVEGKAEAMLYREGHRCKSLGRPWREHYQQASCEERIAGIVHRAFEGLILEPHSFLETKYGAWLSVEHSEDIKSQRELKWEKLLGFPDVQIFQVSDQSVALVCSERLSLYKGRGESSSPQEPEVAQVAEEPPGAIPTKLSYTASHPGMVIGRSIPHEEEGQSRVGVEWAVVALKDARGHNRYLRLMSETAVNQWPRSASGREGVIPDIDLQSVQDAVDSSHEVHYRYFVYEDALIGRNLRDVIDARIERLDAERAIISIVRNDEPIVDGNQIQGAALVESALRGGYVVVPLSEPLSDYSIEVMVTAEWNSAGLEGLNDGPAVAEIVLELDDLVGYVGETRPESIIDADDDLLFDGLSEWSGVYPVLRDVRTLDDYTDLVSSASHQLPVRGKLESDGDTDCFEFGADRPHRLQEAELTLQSSGRLSLGVYTTSGQLVDSTGDLLGAKSLSVPIESESSLAACVAAARFQGSGAEYSISVRYK